MKKLVLIVVLLVVCLSLGFPAQAQAVTFQSVGSFPLNLDGVWFACQANGVIIFKDVLSQSSGSVHFVFDTTLDGNGGFHLVANSSLQGGSAVGLLTGDTYSATGVLNSQGNNGIVGVENTFVSIIQYVNHDGGVFRIFENFHFTVNADGTLTANFDHFIVNAVVCDFK